MVTLGDNLTGFLFCLMSFEILLQLNFNNNKLIITRTATEIVIVNNIGVRALMFDKIQ